LHHEAGRNPLNNDKDKSSNSAFIPISPFRARFKLAVDKLILSIKILNLSSSYSKTTVEGEISAPNSFLNLITSNSTGILS